MLWLRIPHIANSIKKVLYEILFVWKQANFH